MAVISLYIVVTALSCSLCSALVPSVSQNPGRAPTATIDVGIVIGTTTALPSASATVNKFLGIPFAVTPPTRFMPPEPVKKFSSPLNATAWGHACIQQFVCQFSYPSLCQSLTYSRSRDRGRVHRVRLRRHSST